MAEETNHQQQTNQSTQTNQPSGQEQARDYGALFEKLDAILDKRSAGIARSALKDNGIDDTEAAEIVTAYRQQKTAAAQQSSQAMAALQQENQNLRTQLLQGQIHAEAMRQAASLQVSADTVPYLLRLADLSHAADDKGQVNPQAVADALNQVLTDIPALRQTDAQASRGFVPVGGSGGSQQETQEDEWRRKCFGLPAKKK